MTSHSVITQMSSHSDDMNCNIILVEVAWLAHRHIVIAGFSYKELQFVLVYFQEHIHTP